jgi:hypothetical protein
MRSPVPFAPKDREEFKLGLAVEALRRGGRVQLRVWGVSMLPSLWPGDLVTVQAAMPNDIMPGDIGLVLRNKRCFIHRVVAKQISDGGVSFIMRGDAMPDNDPIVVAAEFLGRVIAVRRANRRFVPARRVSLANSAVRWILCRSDRLRSLSLRLHAARLYGWKHVGQPGRLGSFENAFGFSGTSVSRQL